jgi:hypothetical protein
MKYMLLIALLLFLILGTMACGRDGLRWQSPVECDCYDPGDLDRDGRLTQNDYNLLRIRIWGR